jgi:Pilus formation protein N terminal region
MTVAPRFLRVLALALVVCASTARLTAQSEVQKEDVTVYISEVQTVSPGFAMGNIILADPKVAGYEPINNRRELMVRGKKVGTTTVSIWDQRGVLRKELTLNVTTRDAATADDDLKALLKDFPSVEVRRLGGQLIVAGAVSSKDDLAAIEKMAAAAKAKSVVRYVPPGSGLGTAPTSTGPTSTGPASTGPTATGPTTSGPTSTSTPVVTAPGASVMEYEVELLEASSQFATGSYARGIEPSGRSLYKGTVRAAIGQDGTIFIGGKALAPPPDPKEQKKKDKDKKNQGADAAAAAQEEGAETGIRLTVHPNPPSSMGAYKTDVLVETNVPLQYDLYDPEQWRRSRWSFSGKSGDPFGLSGNDLLAAPGISRGSAMGSATRTAGTVARVPGVSGRPGVEYVPVFGSLFRSNSYKKKQTQLLVVLRPRLVAGSVLP